MLSQRCNKNQNRDILMIISKYSTVFFDVQAKYVLFRLVVYLEDLVRNNNMWRIAVAFCFGFVSCRVYVAVDFILLSNLHCCRVYAAIESILLLSLCYCRLYAAVEALLLSSSFYCRVYSTVELTLLLAFMRSNKASVFGSFPS